MTNVAGQTSSSKRIKQQNHVIATKHPQEFKRGTNQYRSSAAPCSTGCPTDIQESEKHTTSTFTGDTTVPPPTETTPLIEGSLVRDEQTNQLYLPLILTVVLKRKQEMLYVLLVVENNLTLAAVVDPKAYVSAIAQNGKV